MNMFDTHAHPRPPAEHATIVLSSGQVGTKFDPSTHTQQDTYEVTATCGELKFTEKFSLDSNRRTGRNHHKHLHYYTNMARNRVTRRIIDALYGDR